MGASESKGPATSQSTEQRQVNRNRIIDQSWDSNALMQLNWASFRSGVSSVCIIITLSILLFFCWRKNKKANRKQHQARLHKIAVIAGRESGRRHQEHHSTPSVKTPAAQRFWTRRSGPHCFFPSGLVGASGSRQAGSSNKCLFQTSSLRSGSHTPWFRLSPSRLPRLWHQAQAFGNSSHGTSQRQPLQGVLHDAGHP